MIIRILGEGQFQVDDADPLQDYDARLEQAVDGGDEQDFRSALAALLEQVRQHGSQVPDEDLDESDAILPGEDASVDEVRALLLDDGVIPG